MRIRCPACQAMYDVPDALVDRPRTVRCAKCAHDWLAVAIAEDPPLPAPAAEVPNEVPPPPVVTPPVAEPPVVAAAPAPAAHLPEPEPEPVLGDTPLSALQRLAAPVDLSPRARRRDHLLTMAWAASFAAIAALGVAGYTERNQLMREWPASKRVYAKLGLLPLDGQRPDGKTAGEAGSR